MEKDSIEYILRCDCGDTVDHCIYIAQHDLSDDTFSDSSTGQCTISTRLNPFLPWYKRIWRAVLYVFGTSEYQYVETMIDVDILKQVVLELKDTRTEEEKHAAREKRSEVKVL